MLIFLPSSYHGSNGMFSSMLKLGRWPPPRQQEASNQVHLGGVSAGTSGLVGPTYSWKEEVWSVSPGKILVTGLLTHDSEIQ